MVKNVYLIGMARSGTYAISNWILGQSWPQKMKFHDLLKSYSDYSEPPKSGYNLFRYERDNLRKLRRLLWQSKIPDNGASFYILRDPYNHFASTLKLWESFSLKRRRKYFEKGIHSVVMGWKEYAKHCLGIESYFPPDFDTINYNKWFSDVDYRKQLSQRMEVLFSDKNIQQVKSFPNPKQRLVSSFDNQKYNGKAQNMDVLERWKAYKNSKLYLDMFDDEIIQYASELFFSPPFKVQV